MKIQTFNVKATVKGDSVTLDHTSRTLIDSTDKESFDEKDIPKKAQDVGSFNNLEQEAIKQMGDGEYTIEYKIIV